jgi:hypothetical protein
VVFYATLFFFPSSLKIATVCVTQFSEVDGGKEEPKNRSTAIIAELLACVVIECLFHYDTITLDSYH